ncbi:MAG: glycosyltransferase family 2 protein [bacterium]
MVDYSIVVPVYYNEGSLKALMDSIQKDVVLRHADLTWEAIFVDDGSGDRSFEELLRIRDEFSPHVRLVKFTRNFGQMSALLAGLARCQSRCVIMMSADGQDPPSLINDMLKAHYEEGYEVVAGTREGRDESLYRIVTSRIFYYLMRKLAFPNMPLGGFDFMLLGERALKTCLANMDANVSLQGAVLWMGHRTKFIPYFRQKRTAGRSRWTFGKKLTTLLDGVMGFSFFPIRLASFLGMLLALLGFLYALDIFIAKLMRGNPVQGWAPIMIAVLIVGGLQLVMLGVMGEYIWRVLAQVRNRQPYVIEKEL